LTTSTALLLASILLFWFLVSFFTKSTGNQKFATDTLFLCLIVGFVIARMIFVLAMWEIYQKDWISAFDIRDGGLNHPLGWFTGSLLLIIRVQGDRKLAFVYVKSALITGMMIFPLFVLNTLINNQNAVKSMELVTAQGENLTLSLRSGKPLIINFWASWCPPCRREMPILQDAQQKYEDFEFIFVNQGEAPTKARQFLKGNSIELHNMYYDLAGRSASQLGAYGLPTTLFYNSEGKLINSHMGELSEATLHHYLQPLTDNSSKK